MIDWFQENGENYPWRRTSDAYKILVSEAMLQQTQVKTVLERGYFENWMQQFPDLATLAAADETAILKAWEGLGYYNRARNLQKAAQFIINELDGEFPTELSKILDLPGVGKYTAGAVASFSFNQPAPIVDGNVIRVLTRVFDYHEPVDTTAGKNQLWSWAEQMTDLNRARLYNSAVMELGQKICRKANPGCQICPVGDLCGNRSNQTALASLPVKKKKVKITQKQEVVLYLCKDNQILLTQESGSQRNGLWRLPLIDKEELKDHWVEMSQFFYAITRYKVQLTVFAPKDSEIDRISKKIEGQWFNLNDELPPLGSPYNKAIRQVLNRA